MAVLLWLTLGSAQRVALSRLQLIANCANALRSRPDVIHSMREMLGHVRPELKSQFDALLTRPRSVQVVMDLTLGVREVIGPDQIEQVFQIVKNSAIEAERVAFEEQVRDVREKARRTISAKDTVIRSMQEQSTKIRDEIDEVRARERGMIKSWVDTIAHKGRKLDQAIRIGVSAVVAIVLFVGAIAGTSWIGFYVAICIALLTFVATVWGIWVSNPAPLITLICKWQQRQLRKIAEQSGRGDLLLYADINWTNLSVSWHGKYGPESNGRKLDLV